MQHYVSDIDGPYVGRQSSAAPVVPGTFGRRNNQRRYVGDVDGIRAVSAFTAAGAATAITMSGPSGGVVSVASTNFTIGANGAIAGTVIVTPSDGGGGGTFTPTTVSISAGSPTATFTYTPASAGAKTISVTNNGGLTNPSNITYTASGAAATATTLSGPSSGTVSVASTNFTVGANGVISGTVIITPSSGGGGGTFTPTTVSISAGSPTATFVYTPSSTGVKTISTTNSGGLTNPSSLTYTSNAAGATSTTLSGPSSGTVLVASTAFSVGANGAITGTVVITPNDAGNGGTFAPTTVSISSGTPTGTFTYTPATVGTKTIATTNSGGLSNPSSLTYTSNSAGALNTYPAFPQYIDSKERPLRGRKIDRASNGAVKARTFYTGTPKVWEVAHHELTTAEKSTWEAFYTANASNSFYFNWTGDGVQYTVIFGEADPVWQPTSGGRWDVMVELLQR